MSVPLLPGAAVQFTSFFVQRFPRDDSLLEAGALDFEITMQSSPQIESVLLKLQQVPYNISEAPVTYFHEMVPILSGSQQGGGTETRYHYRYDFLDVGKYCWFVTTHFVHNPQSPSTVGSLGSWETCFEIEEPEPSSSPSNTPSLMPTLSMLPSALPSPKPSVSLLPTSNPSANPTLSNMPSSAFPSESPSSSPSNSPISLPSAFPSEFPTNLSSKPSSSPSQSPLSAPSTKPSASPSAKPSKLPSAVPSDTPSSKPSFRPSRVPTSSPTSKPTKELTKEPTKKPSKAPSKAPATAAPIQPATYTLRVDITKDQYYDADNTAWRLTKNGNPLRSQKTSGVMQITPGLYCYSMEDEWGDGIQAGGGYSVKVGSFTILSGRHFQFSTGQLCFRVGSNGGVWRVPVPSSNMCGSDDGQNFNICIETVDLSHGALLNNGLVNQFQNGFLAAKQKWESVLVGDDGTTHWTHYGLPVDDVAVMAVAKYVDGVGNTLAFASPSLTKTINGKVRAYTGYMVFDSADIPNLVNGQTFDQVVAHELGHILGIGSLWKENNLFDRDIPGDKYKGDNANREFRNYLSSFGGQINVNDQSITLPIETDGGTGTAGSHFDEDCLNHEIMTGFLDTHNRMSKITIGALQDLGFSVNYNSADDYRMPKKRVDNCMNIINGKRMLRSSKSSERRVRLLKGSHGDYPTPQEIEDATKSGQEYIHRCKNSMSGVELADDELDVGCSHISVIFQSATGSLFGLDVTDEKT